MKRRLFVGLLMAMVCALAQAQRVTLTLHNVSLSEALRQIDRMQDKVRVNFVFDELEDFRVTKRIVSRDVLAAVRDVCGFYPVRISSLGVDIFVECVRKADRKYHGVVTDAAGQALPFANVVLLNPRDSAFITGGVSNEDGIFVIPCEQRRVLARVSYVGCKTEYRTFDREEAGRIALHADAMKLSTVTVKAHAPQYRMTEGGMAVNVEHTLLARMGNALDVLAQLPRVSVTGNSVHVFAKGSPIIYINNKKVADNRELSELKSSEVKSVEVITSPGAQYDATVYSVIRIRTRRSIAEGISFSNTAQAACNSTWKGYGKTTVKYRTGKLEVANSAFFYSSSHKEDNHVGMALNTGEHTINIAQTLVDHERTNILSEKLMLSYDMNDCNSVGASWRYYKDLCDNGSWNSTLEIQRDGVREGVVSQVADKHRPTRPRQELEFYYNGQLGRWSVNLDGSYVFTKNMETLQTEEQSPELGQATINSYGTQRSKMYATKLVLTRPLWGGSLSLGTEYTNTSSLGTYLCEGRHDNHSETDIHETNTAAFVQYSYSVGQYRLSAGVRCEHVSTEYRSMGQREEEPSRTYDEWFPNASISWNKGKWAWQLNYSLKTDRPSYRMLRDYRQYDNPYLYEGGNPYLRPENIHNVEWTAMYDWMTMNMGYNYIENPMLWVLTVQEETQVALLANRNFGHSQSLYAMVSASPKFGWYQPTLSLSFSRYFFDAVRYGADRNLHRPVLSVKLSNRFKISETFTGMLMVQANSRQGSSFMERRSSCLLSATLYKMLMKGRFSIWLQGNDLLGSRERWAMYGIGVNNWKDCNNFGRNVAFTVSYNFNVARSKYKGTGAGSREKDRL